MSARPLSAVPSLRKVLRCNRNRHDNVICRHVTRSVCGGVINTRVPSTYVPFLDSPLPPLSAARETETEREREKERGREKTFIPKKEQRRIIGRGHKSCPLRGAGVKPACGSSTVLARARVLQLALKNIGAN